MILGNFIGWILYFFYGAKYSFKYRYQGHTAHIHVVKRMMPSWAIGQTWGEYVFVRPARRTDYTLLKHEVIHVKQWSEHGFLFLPKYVIGYFQSWRIHGRKQAYRFNRFEVEARESHAE